MVNGVVVERLKPFEDRRANRGAQLRFLSEHREQGTFLSQPAFAVAQFEQAIGVRWLMGGSPLLPCWLICASWYVK